MRMLWIHLTSKSDRKKAITIDAFRILEMQRHGQTTRLILEREGQINYPVEVQEAPSEVVEKIKTAWHYAYGPGRPTPQVWPRTPEGNIISQVHRRDDWTEEHELVRQELIQESPDLFPDGEVPKHLEVALNSNVAVYVRNRRAIRVGELQDLLERIKIEAHNLNHAKGP